MKRQMISAVLERLGLTGTLLTLRRRTRTPWLTVLSYHRVTPDGAVGPLDPGVAISTAEFARQLAIVRDGFDVVGLDEVRAAILHGAQLPASPLLLTFDDGYLDNFEHVLPMLRAAGVRATFFIATAYVAERRLFWWDRIHYVVNQSRRATLELCYPERRTLPLDDGAARTRATAELIELVKTRHALELPRFLDELTERAGVRLDRGGERDLVDEHVMSWSHVRALRAAGMDVQSHTHTHRVVETLPVEALARELAVSRALLLDAVGGPIDAVSYPVGRAPEYGLEVRDALRTAGYALAFSNRAGVNPRARLDAFDVKRLSLENSPNAAHERAVLAIPQLAY